MRDEYKDFQSGCTKAAFKIGVAILIATFAVMTAALVIFE